MDTDALVTELKTSFEAARSQGLIIDGFMLFPAYEGFSKTSYILAVSAPSLANRMCYDKIDAVIDLLHERVSADSRRMIDRVRVYESIIDLKRHSKNGFDDDGCEVCEHSLPLFNDLVIV